MKEQHFLIALLFASPFVLIIVFTIFSKTKREGYSKKEAFSRIRPVLLIYFCSMLFLYISLHITDKESDIRDSLMEKEYSKIEFEGYISSVNILHHFGRPQCLICVRLTHSNIDSFYRYDKIGDGMGLKIKDNLASLPIGGYDARDSLHNYSYIQVNINGSNQIIFSNEKGDSLALPLSYRAGGLFEEDFNVCDIKKQNE